MIQLCPHLWPKNAPFGSCIIKINNMFVKKAEDLASI